jgi:hypothetical protein
MNQDKGLHLESIVGVEAKARRYGDIITRSWIIYYQQGQQVVKDFGSWY